MKIYCSKIRSLLSFPLSLCPLVPLSPWLLVLFPLFLASCSRPDPVVEKRVAVDQFFAQARSCWPSNDSGSDNAGSLKLAIESVVISGNMTQVRLVAFARDEAVDFYLPIYRLSAGRWLINEKGRAFLLDERCREFKLNDSKPSSTSSSIFWKGGRIPENGRIRLNPGQVLETTLVFPPLPEKTRVGALVYDGRLLPYALYSETVPR